MVSRACGLLAGIALTVISMAARLQDGKRTMAMKLLLIGLLFGLAACTAPIDPEPERTPHERVPAGPYDSTANNGRYVA